MFKNYFKTAWRNLIKHKSFSIINISGLSIGIAAALLLFIVVNYELSFDKFQKNYKNIYHIVTQDKFPDGTTYNPGIPGAALCLLRTQMPDKKFAAILSAYGSQFNVEDGNNLNKFIEPTGIFFCEPQFFDVFNYKWLAGNSNVLNNPNQAVLSRSIAEKYFGNWQNAIGKNIKMDNSILLKVGGILEDVPANTDFPLHVLVSFETVRNCGDKYRYHQDWDNLSSSFQVFVLMPDESQNKMNKQLEIFSEKNYHKGSSVRTNFLQPLSEVHFDKRFDNFGDHITSMSTLWTLSLIGIFIIIMACINFINLSTAQAVNRSKEIGIRKVLGSSRSSLFRQVMGETGLMVLFSVLVACGIALLCLPYIKNIASIENEISLFNIEIISFLLIVTLFVTLLSGIYPAFILSGYNPVKALKNKLVSKNGRGLSLRRSLVVAQFAISQILIVGTIVAISQMSFIRNADLGFNKDAVLILTGNTDSIITAKQSSFKQQLLQIPGVKSVSFTSDPPSSDNVWSTNFSYNHLPDANFNISMKFADADYFKTFGIDFIAGRGYHTSDTTDEVVVNKTLLNKLGIKDPNEAIGKELRLGNLSWKPIVGVVKDFNTNSLKKGIQPLVIASRKGTYENTAIKLSTSNIVKTQAEIQSAWNKFYPEYAYSSNFLEDNIAKFYKQETQLSLLYKIFSGLAIFISCLGLYGLVSFMAVQKRKEVGVRKVLGASVANIFLLFSKEFTLLVIIAFAIAIPVAYFMMRQWLNNFAFRINMGWWIFLLATVITIVIALITISFQAIKAAMANPVESLRSE